jgi:predicted AlkP superfamily phosphohydrolase/phosphomutase
MHSERNKNRVLIIGLDGATWNVFDDSLLKSCMPNFWKLKQSGFSGILRSTEPPITPAAWTTCITGCNPGKHGIIGWHKYDHGRDKLSMSSAADCSVPNMWRELSEQGYKVVSINVPWTYPCSPVNGALIAGYGCPGPASDFTYPARLKEQLLSEITDYDIVASWDKSVGYDINGLNFNLPRVERSFEQRVQAARLVSRQVDWDIMMVQFHDTDLLSHHIWPYLDKETRNAYPDQRDRLAVTFTRLDTAIGELLKLARTDDALVAVVSDHGLCRKTAKLKLNVLLCRWGYLRPKNALSRWAERLVRRITYGSERGTRGALKQPQDFEFDWARSKAMMITMAVNGHLFLNVKGRQPNGKVGPSGEFNRTIKELSERFEKVLNPVTGQPIFANVGSPRKIYGLNTEKQNMFGDLVLVPQPGIEISLSYSTKDRAIEMAGDDSLTGTHCYEGIYLFCGRGIRASDGPVTDIVNVAPTIYAALGAKLPNYMDGTVLADIFEKKVNITYQTGRIATLDEGLSRKALSGDEEAEVNRRLSALGYVE